MMKQRHDRRGISLLEVVIAIAILAMSAALLAGIIQLGTKNSLDSRDELQATLICESKLAEIALQALPMQSTDWVNVNDQAFATKQWYYRIDAIQSNVPDIFNVTVYVGDDGVIQNVSKPTAKLTRWFINPALNLDAPASSTSSTTTSTASTSTGGS
jgi:type II secretion system protein I